MTSHLNARETTHTLTSCPVLILLHRAAKKLRIYRMVRQNRKQNSKFRMELKLARKVKVPSPIRKKVNPVTRQQSTTLLPSVIRLNTRKSRLVNQKTAVTKKREGPRRLTQPPLMTPVIAVTRICCLPRNRKKMDRLKLGRPMRNVILLYFNQWNRSAICTHTTIRLLTP